MNRQEAIAELKRMASTIEWDYPLDAQIAIEKAVEALRGPQPDPITGLVPCGWCGPERMGWFSVQFWVRASTGKRKWMSVTQQYKKQVNYCPMCGRKLTAPPRPGAIGPDAGEMAPNGDEGAES